MKLIIIFLKKFRNNIEILCKYYNLVKTKKSLIINIYMFKYILRKIFYIHKFV